MALTGKKPSELDATTVTALKTVLGLKNAVVNDDEIQLGQSADADGANVIAIGESAAAKQDTTYDATAVAAEDAVSIGRSTKACSYRATALGSRAIAGSTSSTAVGYGAVANDVHATVIGRGCYVKKGQGNIALIGGDACHDLYINNGWAHEFDTPPSLVSISSYTPSDITKTLHGQDAYDAKATPDDFNVAGGHLALAAGCGTGSGVGGKVQIKTAPTAAVGQNVKNTLVVTAEFDAILAAAGDTRFLLLDLTDGTLKRVSFGIDDSGGAGYKVLRVEN